MAVPTEHEAPRDWAWVPFLILVLVALVLRLWDLGARAMHHDESLHSLYAWYLYVGRGYVHDPMMHGPLLFHASALMYLLFGDNEVTARLPLVLFGTAAVFLPYFLREELGRFGALAASAMLAFGPAFFYLSRFGHNEAILVFETVLILVGLFGWVRTRRGAYLYAAAAGLGLMFSTKVISLIFGFTIATFILLAIAAGRVGLSEQGVLRAVRDVGWRRLGLCAAIFLGISVVLYTTFFTNLAGLCTAFWSPPVGECAGKQGMLQYWIAQQGVARGNQPWFYYSLLIPLYETVPLALAMVSPFLARRPRTLFFWFCAWWAVFSLGLYSYASEKMPWLMVHPTLPLVMLGALAADRLLSRLQLPWGLTPRQWSLAGLSILGLAAFVAWLTVGGDATTALLLQTINLRRLALGLVLVGIIFCIWRVAASLTARQALAGVAAAGMGILIAYSVHTAWQVTYKNGDVPVEMLVYVQSSPDTPFIVSEVERLGNQLGLRKEVPILLDGGYTETVDGQQVAHEAVSWPFEWYLRDYRGKQYFSKNLPADFNTNRYAAILVMGTNLQPVEDQLGAYTGNKFRLNWWHPEDYKQLTWGTIWETLTDPAARAKLAKYVVHRELMNPPLGARDLYFYVRNDLARGGGVAPSGPAIAAPAPEAPMAPVEEVAVQQLVVYGRPGGQAVLRDPKGIAVGPDGRLYVVDGTNSNVTVFNRDGTVARSWGRKGDRDGEFNEPWGIAVAPDGSVFVADTWNHRIQKFDAEGRFLIKWGTGQIGAEPSQFYGPRDVAITPAGEVLVADTGNKRIQVFDPLGAYRRSFGADGTGPGQFREPVGVTVDARGRIYVADTWNQRVQSFDASFQPLAQYPIRGWSSQSVANKPYIAVTADGDVYATVPERQTIVRLKDGTLSALTLPASPRLGLPTGIEVDAQGRVLVSDPQSGIVVAYDLRATDEVAAPDEPGFAPPP